MAAPAEMFSTLAAVGNREDLSDDARMLDPTQTPFYSSLRERKVKATNTEWQTKSKRAPVLTNFRREGDDVVKTAPFNTVRLSNRVQRFEGHYMVSRTQEAVERAGVSNDLEEQKTMEMLSVKCDIEMTLLSGQASNEEGQDSTGSPDATGGADGGPAERKMGGLLAQITDNVNRGATGANGGYSSGNWQAPTDGTARDLTEAQVKGVLTARFSATGEGNRRLKAFMSPASQNIFAAFPGLSQTRDNVQGGKRTIIAGADLYYTNFGTIEAHAHPYAVSGDVIIVDPEHLRLGVLRGMQSYELQPQGDRVEGFITCEDTLINLQPKAHGLVADLNT